MDIDTSLYSDASSDALSCAKCLLLSPGWGISNLMCLDHSDLHSFPFYLTFYKAF